MDTVTVTPNLTMLRINGWQVYVWQDGESATLIDTGAPGSGTEILSQVPGVERIVLTHGHVDHIGSTAELHDATGAPVLAG
ncbi:MAG TPA: MBL fold metallo-hydrolase, partial [Mycobacterium sp.]|nr:MBL fold metallo-hydrolase [Mycobacterium sp.]